MARKNLFDPGQIDKSAAGGTARGSASPASRASPPSPALSKKPMSVAPLALLREDLNRMIRDIRPDLIDDSRWSDRMPGTDPALENLIESMRDRGQMVPAMVRPLAGSGGRFEIIYGRRRLAAARALGVPLKAIVHEFDDTQSVIAQGLENNSRLEPSFIEKAVFANDLKTVGGYSLEVIAETINTHPSNVSRMTRIVTDLGRDIISLIGPCHGIGRRQWSTLADLALLSSPEARLEALRSAELDDEPEARLAQAHDILQSLSGQSGPRSDDADPPSVSASAPATPQPSDRSEPKDAPSRARFAFGRDRRNFAEIRSSKLGATIKFPSKSVPEGFDEWVNRNGQRVVEEIHELWKQENPDSEA